MTCEMCHGHDFLKTDGEYVCQGCGTRYTPAEALGLLTEGGREPDRDEDVKHFLDLAIQSKSAGNFYEAEHFCNKVLEIDVDNYLAWRNKADVVVRQVTVDDDRTVDAISCYREALRCAPEELRENLRRESGERLRLALVALAFMTCKRYDDSALLRDGEAVLSLPYLLEDRAAQLRAATGAEAFAAWTRERVAGAMNGSAVNVWAKRLLPAYSSDEHRGKQAMDAFVAGGDQVISVLAAAMRLFPEGEDCARACLRTMIAVQEALVDAHSMRYDGRRWVRCYSLSDEDKESRRQDVFVWRGELAKLGVGDEVTRNPQAGPAVRQESVAKPGVGDEVARNPQAGPAVRQESVAKPEGKRGIMHRTVTWKGTIGLICFGRFLALVTNANQVYQSLSFIWLFLGVLFMAWWYETS